jgi:hypothetical protein
MMYLCLRLDSPLMNLPRLLRVIHRLVKLGLSIDDDDDEVDDDMEDLPPSDGDDNNEERHV